jgi:hypothetical protein
LTTLLTRPAITRWLPWNDFDDPHLIACKVDIKGVSYIDADLDEEIPPMQSGNVYEFAEFTVDFAAPLFKLGDRTDATSQEGKPTDTEVVRFATKSVAPGVELVTAGIPTFKFSDLPPPNEILFPIPLVLSIDSYVISLWGWPIEAVNHDALRRCVGKVNDEILELPDLPPPRFYDKETLKLDTYKLEYMWFPDGTRAVNIHMFVKYRAKNGEDRGGWNDYPAADGTFHPVVRIVDTTNGPYLKEDFSKLFKPLNE